jgi:hypothetical protein
MLWRTIVASAILVSMMGAADATGGLSCSAEDSVHVVRGGIDPIP